MAAIPQNPEMIKAVSHEIKLAIGQLQEGKVINIDELSVRILGVIMGEAEKLVQDAAIDIYVTPKRQSNTGKVS